MSRLLSKETSAKCKRKRLRNRKNKNTVQESNQAISIADLVNLYENRVPFKATARKCNESDIAQKHKRIMKAAFENEDTKCLSELVEESFEEISQERKSRNVKVTKDDKESEVWSSDGEYCYFELLRYL